MRWRHASAPALSVVQTPPPSPTPSPLLRQTTSWTCPVPGMNGIQKRCRQTAANWKVEKKPITAPPIQLVFRANPGLFSKEHTEAYCWYSLHHFPPKAALILTRNTSFFCFVNALILILKTFLIAAGNLWPVHVWVWRMFSHSEGKPAVEQRRDRHLLLFLLYIFWAPSFLSSRRAAFTVIRC